MGESRLKAPEMAFSHMGMYVTNLGKMADFYTRVLGFSITDEGSSPRIGRDFVFLSRDPDEHHQIVLISGREEGSPPTINQLSFRVTNITELRRLHEVVKREKDVSGIAPLNHGNAWSVYFNDPEGNTIELFVQSPWYVPAPSAWPLDLSLSDEELIERTEAECRTKRGFMLRADYYKKMRGQLEQEGKLQVRTPPSEQMSV